MERLYILVWIVLVSCTKASTKYPHDLKFPDPAKDFIKQNQIDTTLIYILQDDGSDLKYYRTYDQSGNVLVDSTNYKLLIRNHYDEHGLLTSKERWKAGELIRTDSLSYDFDKDSLILRQRWTKSQIQFTFYLDDKNRVKKTVETRQPDSGAKIISDYTYERDLLQKCQVHLSNRPEVSLVYQYYYSSKSILDSVTFKTNSGHRQRWDYDSVGLLKAEWYNGYRHRDRFVHKVRFRKTTPG